MKAIFQFPGQTSRYAGMLEKLAGLSPRGRDVIEEASQVLGRDLIRHYRSRSQPFRKNRDVQIAVFVANQVFSEELRAAGVEAVASAGLSLGEWNHLVHIGALDFTTALGAVERRGEAYDAGPKGAMAAVFPMELSELESAVDAQRNGDVLEVVNRNSPRQNVIAGDEKAVARAGLFLEEEHYVSVSVIERNLPMHSTLFASVAEQFLNTLRTLPFARPRLPYVPNRLGHAMPTPTDADYRELLSTHVCRPVLWRKTIDDLLRTHPDAALVEVGPRSILTHLLDRKWHPRSRRLHVDVDADLPSTRRHLDQVIAALDEVKPNPMEVGP